jgi:hypothetical protein
LTPGARLRLRSFKLHFVERHVRIVPAEVDGAPFAGPGVSLRGPVAERALQTAGALVDALRELEPGALVRALSADLAAPRLLVSLPSHDPAADPRPRAVRLTGPAAESVLARGGALLALLESCASEALARRLRTTEP